MDDDDPFSRELRSARDRIAELRRRSRGTSRRGGLLPEALAELDEAIEELSVTGEQLRSQTGELTAARTALEAERHRYQELFESAPVAYLITDPLARSGRPTGRRRPCSAWTSGSWPASPWSPMWPAATAGGSGRWSTGSTGARTSG
jgi:PAS domain-containing protein